MPRRLEGFEGDQRQFERRSQSRDVCTSMPAIGRWPTAASARCTLPSAHPNPAAFRTNARFSHPNLGRVHILGRLCAKTQAARARLVPVAHTHAQSQYPGRKILYADRIQSCTVISASYPRSNLLQHRLLDLLLHLFVLVLLISDRPRRRNVALFVDRGRRRRLSVGGRSALASQRIRLQKHNYPRHVRIDTLRRHINLLT